MRRTLIREHGGENKVPRRQHQCRVLGRPVQTDQPAFNLNQTGIVIPANGLFRRDRGSAQRSGGRQPLENGVRHGRLVLVSRGEPCHIHHIAHGERGVLGGLDT